MGFFLSIVFFNYDFIAVNFNHFAVIGSQKQTAGIISRFFFHAG